MAIQARSLLALAIVVFSASLLLIVLSGGLAAGQVTEVLVTIDELDRDQTARPTDTQNDLLTFHGEIALDKTIWLPGTSVDLTPRLQLSPQPPTAWEVLFDPEFLTYTASGVKNFTATLVVPVGMPAASIRQLTFNVTTSDLIFYNLEEGFAQVTIAQYYKIGRQYSTLPLKVTQGEIVEFNITIMNRGNGPDTFLLQVSNELELGDAGLTVLYNPSSGRVSPGGEDDVELRLQAADDAILSEFSLNLTITSEESTTDPNADTVTSGAEWTIVVEAGIGTTITNNLKYIIPGVVLAAVVIGFVLFRRKRMREAEADGEGEEKAEASKGKKPKKGEGSKGDARKGKKGTPKEAPPKKPRKPPQKRRPSSDDGSEDRYYGE